MTTTDRSIAMTRNILTCKIYFNPQLLTKNNGYILERRKHVFMGKYYTNRHRKNSHKRNNNTLKIPLRCAVLIQTVQLIL